MRWFKSRHYQKPATLTFTKVQTLQSPLAVSYGYEEEKTSDLWRCEETGLLYKKVDKDFVFVKTYSLQEMIEKTKQE